jgi:hypothetical protein
VRPRRASILACIRYLLPVTYFPCLAEAAVQRDIYVTLILKYFPCFSDGHKYIYTDSTCTYVYKRRVRKTDMSRSWYTFDGARAGTGTYKR